MSRFEERLRTGPPIVADGGMGALISAAVPRLRCPEEANLRSPESVISVHVGYIRAGAELIETYTGGARDDRRRHLHRRLDRPARGRRAAAGEPRGAVRRAGVDPRRARRRPLH